MNAIEEPEELAPSDRAFCEWLKLITARTKLSQAARLRIETLLSSLLPDVPRPGFRSPRFHSPV